jgi:hypothetical protein
MAKAPRWPVRSMYRRHRRADLSLGRADGWRSTLAAPPPADVESARGQPNRRTVFRRGGFDAGVIPGPTIDASLIVDAAAGYNAVPADRCRNHGHPSGGRGDCVGEVILTGMVA